MAFRQIREHHPLKLNQCLARQQLIEQLRQVFYVVNLCKIVGIVEKCGRRRGLGLYRGITNRSPTRTRFGLDRRFTFMSAFSETR